jgi:hypothetical protein
MSQTTDEYNGYSEQWCVESIKRSPFVGSVDKPEGKLSFNLNCPKVVGWYDNVRPDTGGFSRPMLQRNSYGVTAMSYTFTLDTDVIPALLKSGALHLWTLQSACSISVVRPELLPPDIPCTKHDKDFLYMGKETDYDSIQEAMGDAEAEVDGKYPLEEWIDVDDVLANKLHWTWVTIWSGDRQQTCNDYSWLNRGGHIEDPNEQFVTNAYYGSDFAAETLKITHPLEFRQFNVPEFPEIPEIPPTSTRAGLVSWTDGTKSVFTEKIVKEA